MILSQFGMRLKETTIVNQNKTLLFLLIFIMVSFTITGVVADGAGRAFSGFLSLQFQPVRLISDFISTNGIGASLINATVVGITGLLLITLSKVRLSGPTFAAIFTMMGFALFGKTPLNILPIIMGVYLSGKLVGKSFSEYIIIALFGTALGPLVNLVAFELWIYRIVCDRGRNCCRNCYRFHASGDRRIHAAFPPGI